MLVLHQINQLQHLAYPVQYLEVLIDPRLVEHQHLVSQLVRLEYLSRDPHSQLVNPADLS